MAGQVSPSSETVSACDSPSVKQECVASPGSASGPGSGSAAGSGGGATAIPAPTAASAEPAMPGKKRASTSSRGVANLTAEQLAKKRANDREAQRAIRKRTRTQIELLEQRVRELTSLQPYQDLQEALRQKHILQAENNEIKRRLASAMATLQPILNHHSGPLTSTIPPLSPHNNDIPSTRAHRPNSVANADIPPTPPPQSDYPGSQQQAPQGEPSDRRLRNPASAESTNGAAGAYTSSPATSVSPSPSASSQAHGHRQSWQQNAPASRNTDNTWPPHNQLFDYQKRNLTHNLELSGNGERLGLNFLLDSTQNVPKINDFRIGVGSSSANGPLSYNNRLNPPSYGDSNMCPYSIPIRNVEPTCPLDGILLDFLRTRQREAAEGVPNKQLVGPPYPSVSSLLNPAKGIYSHPLSKVFTDILSKFPNISNLPEQVAVLYVMFLLMRWQIYPTRENYDRLPEWMTPRTSQIVTPHAAWIDYLPWPRMRDRMVASYADYDFSNWFIPYTTGLSLNWPYEPTDTLLATNDSDELIINPVFERHLRDLNNWSLGTLFATTYPHLVDTTRIVPESNSQHKNRSSG
ncbi:BZIP transcription factor [Trichophyton interdigitale]|nr:BZIP transcription factor [Trichophyton interdigitale]KAG5218135.1 BZIP transcription factor [Trichophyton interdigitale]KAG8208793.1 BZIP transcription factor [Trichophyton interdigitale]